MFECLLVFELCKEIEQFLRHRSSGIAGYFENEEFVMSFGIPCNKLSIYISCIGSGTYVDFPQLGAVSKGKISLIIVIEI